MELFWARNLVVECAHGMGEVGVRFSPGPPKESDHSIGLFCFSYPQLALSLFIYLC